MDGLGDVTSVRCLRVRVSEVGLDGIKRFSDTGTAGTKVRGGGLAGEDTVGD